MKSLKQKTEKYKFNKGYVTAYNTPNLVRIQKLKN